MRTFIAIEIPGNIRDSIAEQIETSRVKQLPVKWVAHDNLHITLKFLGELTEATRKKVSSLLKKTVVHQIPFTATLKDFGCFPHPRRPRVLWIGVDRGADQLTALAREVEESLAQCGFPREGRFHPHLTIGRVKKPCSLEGILKHKTQSELFKVETLVLFKSTLTPQGAVYEALETFPFKK